MSTPSTPSSPKPAGDDRNLVPVDENYVAPSFEDRVRIFWEKNNKAVYGVLVVILLAIVAKEGWDYLAAQREKGVEQAYAAATTPAQLRTFIGEHPQHTLAGVAQLQLADEAYAGGRYGEAVTAYEQASGVLKNGPLASRARLGAAMAKLQGGRESEGEAALKALAADEKEPKAYRLEAAYHLTSLAAERHNATDVKTYSDQVMQLDPASPWTQRAMHLRASVPSAEAPVPAADANADQSPAIKLPGR